MKGEEQHHMKWECMRAQQWDRVSYILSFITLYV